MTATRDRIEKLVMEIQEEFLNEPTLALTLRAAQKRLRVDEVTCGGVLGALVDARVLARRGGEYRRHFPRRVARCAA